MIYSRNKGFTLIELIIGITILALLAVGLLAALDPAEQFNKARDTATRNTLLEVFSAFQRYEAAQESYPSAFTALNPNEGTSAKDMMSAIDDLIASGELKPNFKSAAGKTLDEIYIYKDADNKVLTCFKPKAKSFKLAAGLFTNAQNASILGKEAPASRDEQVTCESGSTNIQNGAVNMKGGSTIIRGNAAQALEVGSMVEEKANVQEAIEPTTNCSLGATNPALRECCVYCAQ